jgi:hypothetical protein
LGNRYVLAVFLVFLPLSVPFVPPAIHGFLWPVARETVAALGCSSLSCIRYIIPVAVIYAFLVSVVLGNLVRLAIHEAS